MPKYAEIRFDQIATLVCPEAEAQKHISDYEADGGTAEILRVVELTEQQFQALPEFEG